MEIRGTTDDGRERVYLLEHVYGAKLEEHPLPSSYGIDPDESGRYDLYEVIELRDGWRVNAQKCHLVWLPDLLRGAVDNGADPTWSDAQSPEELARLVLITGEVS
jgi:hypothetical protein